MNVFHEFTGRDVAKITICRIWKVFVVHIGEALQVGLQQGSDGRLKARVWSAGMPCCVAFGSIVCRLRQLNNDTCHISKDPRHQCAQWASTSVAPLCIHSTEELAHDLGHLSFVFRIKLFVRQIKALILVYMAADGRAVAVHMVAYLRRKLEEGTSWGPAWR
jgi:hypothetical protein